jgi:RNA polymerase sigma-70 factor (sigma-E family)
VDSDDFAAFVAARSPALFRTAMALTGNREQAEDLLQTALARCVRHWGRIRDGQPEAYVRTTMYRQQASFWRGRRRGHDVPSERLPEVAGADATAGVDLTIALAAALRQLPARQRAVLVLRYFEDRPTEEIAALLGCGASTVRSQAARALERLRRLCPELDSRAAQEICP